MQRFLGRYSAFFYALLRIISGAMFAWHGSQKVFGANSKPLTSLLGIGGVIELVGGILIAVGLCASIAAFIASGEMAVAYFKAHSPDGWNPVQNHGELAVLYCFIFLYIASQGSGVLSLDSIFRRSKLRR
ncbi:MAG: DoxX family protein [Blastocatellia bacterium AA13]|nr:MAG: DoxX family protein [Blastocatellia bacterium AA13]